MRETSTFVRSSPELTDFVIDKSIASFTIMAHTKLGNSCSDRGVYLTSSVEQQIDVLMQGTDYGDEKTSAVMRAELGKRLQDSAETGKALKVYCGYDPRRPDLHLGHTITMRKLRQFQDFGHEVTFLIGTYTSLIGDPSDVTSARDQLTAQNVAVNSQTYAEQ